MSSFQHRALVVDDCDIIRKLALVLLDRNGIPGEAAASLDEARQMFSVERFDLVIADFDLGPGETGLQLLEQVRALPASMRPAFILMSGQSLEYIDPDGTRLRGVPFVEKPFDIRTFQREIDAFLTQGSGPRRAAVGAP